MPIKHAFVSAIADDAVPAGKVQPSNWNANHDLSGLVRSDLPTTVRPGAQLATPPLSSGGSAALQSIFPSGTLNGATTFTGGTYRAEKVQFFWPVTIQALAVLAGAGTAGSALGAGLYAADNSTRAGYPGTKLFDFGEMDLSTGVSGDVKLASGGAITIPAGDYWLVFGVKATTSTPSLQNQTVTPLWPRFLIASTAAARLELTQAYANPMPSHVSSVWTHTATAMVNPVFGRFS